ncbi:hypothetical protein LXT21_13440 [Myxococcus sp. K38C18041901]|nr:hypothetical protein [Myxococcus guangdongensis]MCP3059783.1 hypothetical protein [Myxococcus guangdongensis]
MDWYIKGLLLEGERKSIDPIAGMLVGATGERAAMPEPVNADETATS